MVSVAPDQTMEGVCGVQNVFNILPYFYNKVKPYHRNQSLSEEINKLSSGLTKRFHYD